MLENFYDITIFHQKQDFEKKGNFNKIFQEYKFKNLTENRYYPSP